MQRCEFENVPFECADVVFEDAVFESFDSMPHPSGHSHDPSDETIAGSHRVVMTFVMAQAAK